MHLRAFPSVFRCLPCGRLVIFRQEVTGFVAKSGPAMEMMSMFSGRRLLMDIVACLLMATLSACASSRQSAGPEIAGAAGWRWESLSAGRFDLASASLPNVKSQTLVVYLEGDGFAYVSAHQPSMDPTPTDPLALRLALRHSGTEAVAWLGRPCQYAVPSHKRNCDVRYWTSHRYAPEAVDSLSAAIDQLKQRTQASRVILVGYSGGGAMAVLLAARRADVAGVATIVANLDLGYWTRRDGLSPLTGSLDPADVAQQLGRMPQIHFAGGADKTVGPDVTQSFISHLPPGAPARIVVREGYTHICCWADDWSSAALEGLTDPR